MCRIVLKHKVSTTPHHKTHLPSPPGGRVPLSPTHLCPQMGGCFATPVSLVTIPSSTFLPLCHHKTLLEDFVLLFNSVGELYFSLFFISHQKWGHRIFCLNKYLRTDTMALNCLSHLVHIDVLLQT